MKGQFGLESRQGASSVSKWQFPNRMVAHPPRQPRAKPRKRKYRVPGPNKSQWRQLKVWQDAYGALWSAAMDQVYRERRKLRRSLMQLDFSPIEDRVMADYFGPESRKNWLEGRFYATGTVTGRLSEECPVCFGSGHWARGIDDIPCHACGGTGKRK